MRIAVIIPLYNGARWIEATLAAVTTQTRPADEILVIDDGSTDDSVARAGRFAGVSLLRNPGKGPNPARAHGLGLVSSELVALLDQDDLWHPEHLERLAGELERDSGVPGAVGGMVKFQDGGAPSYATDDRGAGDLDPWASCPLCPIATPSQVLFRRDALKAAGGWGAQRIGGADFEAWLRLGASRPLRRTQAVTVGYRQHADSYGVTLRRDDRLGFLNRSTACAADCLGLRLGFHPADERELTARLDLLRAIAAWGGAEGAREGSVALRRAEQALRLVSEEGIWLVFAKVLYFHEQEGGAAGRLAKAKFLMRMLLACPWGASALRRELLRRAWCNLLRRPIRRPVSRAAG